MSFVRRLVPRRPGQKPLCFWGCGTAVKAMLTLCPACQEEYRRMAEGMPPVDREEVIPVREPVK